MATPRSYIVSDASCTDYDYLVKLVMIGDSGVGKTALASRFVDNKYTPSDKSTIGVDLRIKTMSVMDKKVKLQLWDTAGQERFRAITQCYYRGSDAVVLVCDLTNANCLRSLPRWLDDVYHLAKKNARVIVCGNKCDQEEKRQVSMEDIRAMFDHHHHHLQDVLFLETSAKTGKNVLEAYKSVAEATVKQMQAQSLQYERHANNAYGDRLDVGGESLLGGRRVCPCTII
ncbi:hypothetical protein AAMO2058_001590900 [Amorphochlora amoebiformis]